MSRCRSTSFYLAPGHLVYFKDYTLATWDPTTKEIVQFTHRGDLAAFSKANPSWDGVCVVSNLDFYSLEAAVRSGDFTYFSANWGGADDEDWDVWDDADDIADGHGPAGQGDDLIVELWRLDARTIEGRRPKDSPEFAVHRWAHGGAAAAGGVRSIVDACFPSAKKNLARAATDAVLAGETLRVYIASEALAANLITPAEAAALLSKQSSAPPLPVLPRPATRRLLEHVLKDLEQPERIALLHELSDPWRFVNDADRLALAASPASPAGVLEFLSQGAPEDLRSVLIGNPALPRAAALRLMLEEVAKERPSRAIIAAYGTRSDVTFEAATQELKEAMRAQLDSTGPFRMRGVTNWAVLSDLATAFARHPHITAEQAGELVTECGLPRHAFARLLEARQDLPESAIRSVLAQGLSTLDINGVPEVIKAAALSHPNCPKDLLVSAARLPRWSAAVVKHPSLTLDEALDVYETGGPGVEAALAQRHDIEPEMLSVLATSYQRDTVAAVAGNPLTPPEALAQLARRDIVPLAVVLANPSCPEGVVKHHLRKPESLLEIFAPTNAHGDGPDPSDYCAKFAAVSVEDFAAGLRALEKDLKERGEIEYRSRYVYRVLCQAPFPEEDITRLFLALSDTPSAAAVLASNPSLDASYRRRVFSTLTMRQRQTLIDSLLTPCAPEEDLLCAVAASDGDPVVVSKAIAFGLPGRSAFRSVTPAAAQRILDLVAAGNYRPSELRGLSQAALAEHPSLAGYVRALASKHFARPVGSDAAQAPASLGEYLLHDKQGKPLADQVPAQEPLALRFTQPLSNALLSGKPISKGTRSLAELPNAREGAFPLTAEQSDLADVLNGRKVPGGVIRVLDSRAALSKNANFMGNCTAIYGAAIAEGSTLMLAIDNEAGKTVWNVSLNKSSYAGTWSIGEINTRFNSGSGGARPLVDALAELGINSGSRHYDAGGYYVDDYADDYDEGAIDPVHLEHPDDYYVPNERLDEPSYADGLAYPDEDDQISFGGWYSEHAAENWTAGPPEFPVATLLQAKPLTGTGSAQWWEELEAGRTPSPIERWEDWEEANLGGKLAKELLRTRAGAERQPSRKR